MCLIQVRKQQRVIRQPVPLLMVLLALYVISLLRLVTLRVLQRPMAHLVALVIQVALLALERLHISASHV